MDSKTLYQFCRDSSNDGISVWVYQGKTLTYLCANPRGYPKFNSNFTYVVVDQRSKYSVMGDTPVDQYKAFVWIGSRSAGHHAHFESTMDQLNDLREENAWARIRVYVEFQYAESFQFMTLFQRFQRVKDQQSSTSKPTSFAAIQYQEYYCPPKGVNRPRAISFPKVLILE